MIATVEISTPVFLICEGSCGRKRSRLPTVTEHEFKARDRMHSAVETVKLYFDCTRCGHRRLYGVEAA